MVAACIVTSRTPVWAGPTPRPVQEDEGDGEGCQHHRHVQDAVGPHGGGEGAVAQLVEPNQGLPGRGSPPATNIASRSSGRAVQREVPVPAPAEGLRAVVEVGQGERGHAQGEHQEHRSLASRSGRLVAGRRASPGASATPIRRARSTATSPARAPARKAQRQERCCRTKGASADAGHGSQGGGHRGQADEAPPPRGAGTAVMMGRLVAETRAAPTPCTRAGGQERPQPAGHPRPGAGQRDQRPGRR